MSRTPATARSAAVLVGLLGLGVSACGSADLSAAQLEDEVSERLAGVDSQAAPMELHCEGGLSAQAGAHRDCRARMGDEQVDLRVRTSATDPLEVSVVPFLAPDALADEVATILEKGGHHVGECTCAEELMGRAGARASCELVADDRSHEVDAVVTGLDGFNIDITIQEN